MREGQFEDSVFGTLARAEKLNTAPLLKAIPNVKIAKQGDDYVVTLPRTRTASRSKTAWMNFLSDSLGSDPLNGRLVIQDDLRNFEPNEEMIFISKVPLWGIEASGANTFKIKRLWA